MSQTADPSALIRAREPDSASAPGVVDQVALARLYGEPLFAMPQDLYIPPDALEVFLEAFEGPLDLLLYLIRKQNFNILDIPMAGVTRQYLVYVEEIKARNLELAAEYLLMAAMLIEIKSRMLLPMRKADDTGEVEDPRAELVRRLLEYERMKQAAHQLGAWVFGLLAFGYLFRRQQHARLDFNQHRGHQQVFSRQFEVGSADFIDIHQVLARHRRHRDVKNIEVLLADQVQQQVQRAFKRF